MSSDTIPGPSDQEIQEVIDSPIMRGLDCAFPRRMLIELRDARRDLVARVAELRGETTHTTCPDCDAPSDEEQTTAAAIDRLYFVSTHTVSRTGMDIGILLASHRALADRLREVEGERDDVAHDLAYAREVEIPQMEEDANDRCDACEEVARLRECLLVAGLQAFLRERDPEDVAEHLRKVLKSYTDEIARLSAALDTACKDAARVYGERDVARAALKGVEG